MTFVTRRAQATGVGLLGLVVRSAVACQAERVNPPVRLFLASPALAIRRALAKALDAEARIVVVGEARSSAQALTRVPAARPDVVLAGAHMTEPDSPEMCRRLRETLPALQVLMIGVNAPLELIDAALRAGAAGVVPHTIDEPELVEAIETAAAGRAVMSTDTLTNILRWDALARRAGPALRPVGRRPGVVLPDRRGLDQRRDRGAAAPLGRHDPQLCLPTVSQSRCRSPGPGGRYGGSRAASTSTGPTSPKGIQRTRDHDQP